MDGEHPVVTAEEEQEDNATPIDPTLDTGCLGAAQEEIVGMDAGSSPLTAVYEDPQWAELVDQMDNLSTKLESDPRIQDLNTKWTDCMADAGHDFATSYDAQMSITQSLESAWGQNGIEPSDADMASIRDQEVALAVADYTCQDSIDFVAEQERVRFDLEQAFVDENTAELKAFAAAIEAAGA